jgi:uncharacterized membrane protein
MRLSPDGGGEPWQDSFVLYPEGSMPAIAGMRSGDCRSNENRYHLFTRIAIMIKTLTFTTMHIGIAFIVVYLMTGSVIVGGAVALVEPLCNSVGYFFHERVWERIRNRSGSLLAAS